MENNREIKQKHITCEFSRQPGQRGCGDSRFPVSLSAADFRVGLIRLRVEGMEDNEKQARLWVPNADRGYSGDSIQGLVKAYSLFLEVCFRDHLKSFEDRLGSDPDAANAEAVVFSWLRHQGHRPNLAESLSAGGGDYLCTPESRRPFLVEVTHLNKDAVEQRSGWPDELSEVARSFSQITPNLWSKARGKAPQLADHEGPRVLAICLAHIAASVLLGRLAAQWLMISEPKIEVPLALNGESKPARNVTDLKNAAFFKLQAGAIVPVRQSISAILLIAIWEKQLEVVGMLHPKPAVPFDYHSLGDVPFLRVQWPIVADEIRTEWVIANPNPVRYYHNAVTFTNEELRGECQ